MRRALVAVIVTAGMFGGWTARGLAAGTPSSGRVRAVVTFLGDSNITDGAKEIAQVLTFRNAPYATVDLSRAGARIRTPDCPMFALTCATNDWWKTRIAQAKLKISSDIYVVNLGVNDALSPGIGPTAPGYAFYSAKIDWLMVQTGTKPVIWTTLPCAVEPPAVRPGCQAVNAALLGARTRWARLTVIDWGATANHHPEWMEPGLVHYTSAGHIEWAKQVAASLDRRFPA